MEINENLQFINIYFLEAMDIPLYFYYYAYPPHSRVLEFFLCRSPVSISICRRLRFSMYVLYRDTLNHKKVASKHTFQLELLKLLTMIKL